MDINSKTIAKKLEELLCMLDNYHKEDKGSVVTNILHDITKRSENGKYYKDGPNTKK